MDLNEHQAIYHECFSSNISDTLQNLYENKHFSDVTLISEDFKQVAAHKFILSSCSRLFARILTNLPQPTGVIYLRGLNSREMEYLLQFCYLGEVKISNDDVDKFLDLMKEFEISNSDNIDNENQSQGEEVKWQNKDDMAETIKEETEKYEVFKEDIKDKVLQELTESEAIGTENMDDTKAVTVNKAKKPYTMKKRKVLEDRSLQCDICGYIAQRFCHLQSHRKSVHMGLKNYVPTPCDVCGKVLGSKLALLAHKRNIHDNIPFKCDVENCTYSVKSKMSLDQHRKYVHEGKEYLCEGCPKKFIRKAQMKKHYLLQHSDAPYILCEKCDYKTKDKDRFRMHQKVHDDNKISCDKCDFKTVWNYNLNEHLRKVHKQPVHKCDFCPFDSVSEAEVRKHVNFTHCQGT